MKISFAMMWDLLNVKYPQLKTGIYDSHEVKGVKLLGKGVTPEKEWLYIGARQDALVLCCGGFKDVLKTDIPLPELFNVLQEIFNRLRDWDRDIHLAIIEGCDPQKLVNISESVLSNPVTLMDPAYKLLAISSHENSKSDIFNAVRAKGYLPPETVEFYRTKGFMKALASSEDELSCISENECTSVIYPLRVNGTIAAFLTMPCINKPYSQGLAECFRGMAEGIIICMEQQLHLSDIDRNMYEYLLVDILDRKLRSKAALDERLRYVELPVRGELVLLAMSMGKDYVSISNYLSHQVEELLPGERVFLYRENILVLLEKKRLASAMQELELFLEENSFCCGVSRQFNNLLTLPAAYKQACAAIRLGTRISSNKTLKKLGVTDRNYGKTVFNYDNYFRYHVVEAAAEAKIISPMLLTLIKADERENNDHLRVLHAFLLCERRPTLAASQLHMHRNNVIYRVDRIENILNVQLEDQEIRQELEISLLAMELMDAEEIQQNAQ
ncbi:MAG: helix-turn-helix domain-containing protein [Oscillospiraceae bacterium]|nr:helix-turn-helix domain-containing protein [Oscillospiraceae bacterium]